MRCLTFITVVKTRIRSVLVVDDDEDWRAMMAEVLAEAGFFVSTASDGRAAVQSWQGARTQVVVTDVQMPVMDGRELLATLQSIDRNIPVIVLTGEDLSDTIDSTLAGAFRVIQKPASTDDVLSAVTDAFLRDRQPSSRRIANAARAVMVLGRKTGHAALSRAASFLRPRKRAERPIVRKRRRAGLAVAGFGAAAAVAVLIAAIRGLVV
jgi:DNA-binding NtrC family response regulator